MTAPDPIATAIFALLADRRPGATICPSEVARALAPEDWRPLMPAVRDVARALAADCRLQITQGGVTIDPSVETRGAVRLGLPGPAPDSVS